MDDNLLLQYSKELSLDFLHQIGAEVNESDGLYNVQIPTKYEQIFGGNSKRITFDHDVADTHSCELVLPGSNFLSIILNEVRKQAPVVGAHLKKLASDPKDFIDKISTHNCKVSFSNSNDEAKIAIRFYFNITVKSIKSISMVRWIDVDLETQHVLDFPSELTMDTSVGKIKYENDDKRIGICHTTSIEFLEDEVKSLALKFVDLTKNNLTRDTNSINQAHNRRITEINQDLRIQRSKLSEYDRKITNARHYDTQEKYVQQKIKHEERLKKEEQKAAKFIEKLTKDKNAQIEQIEKRYRPTIDFSLIAAHAYSYNASNCELEFKNNFTQKQVNAIFLDPASSFTILCEVCNNNIENTNLCFNSHISCDFCSKHCVKCKKDVCLHCEVELNPCYICREGLCTNCTTNCKFCSELICESHQNKCPHCSEITCFFCSDKCEICFHRFCDNTFHSCNYCKKRICQVDSKPCVECNLQFCPNDRAICAICGEIHCENDSLKCQLCEQTYNNNCIGKKLCQTCNTLHSVEKENLDVKDVIIVDPSLNKYKNWECASNNKYLIFKAKKLLGSKIIVYDKIQKIILIKKKGGWR